MINPDTGEPWQLSDSTVAVDGRDRDRSAVSDVPKKSGPGGFFSRHHRQLRRSGNHSPANLVLLIGSGTSSEHGWMHRNVGVARVLGYIVEQHEDPAQVPVYRLDAYGMTYGWHLQTDDAQLEPCPPPDRHPEEVITAALTLFDELKTGSRLTANRYL